MPERSTLDKLAAKLPVPKNHVIHGLKSAEEMFTPDWGFDRTAGLTNWSTTPGIFRCRMRRNHTETRAAFELELRPERAHEVTDVLQVIIFPVHIDMRSGYSVEGFSLDTRHRYSKEAMLGGVTVPIVVDLIGSENPQIECTSVMVSVTMPREDGAYEIDMARFMWYFGKAATYGPRPAHLPLYLQQQLREERINLRARHLPPCDASTTTSRDDSKERNGRSSSFSKKVLKVTKKVFSAPPGAGIPAHFAPKPYVAHGDHLMGYYTTPYRGFDAVSLSDSSTAPESYAPNREDTKANGITETSCA